jgi:hypothetical protein
MVGLASVSPAPAQNRQERDPVAAAIAETAQDYMRAMAGQKFDDAVNLVEKASLESMQTDQIEFLKAAPTMKHEEAALARLGIADISVLEKMTPEEVFILRSKAQFAEKDDNEELVEQISSTLKFQVLAVVKETAQLAHVLLRSSHERRDKRVAALDLVSLVLEGKTWKISLNAQEPQISDLKKEE